MKKTADATDVQSWSLSRVYYRYFCRDRIRGLHFLHSDLFRTNPRTLVLLEGIDGHFNRLLSSLRLAFGSGGTALGGIGGFSGYSNSSSSNDPLANCGDGEDRTKRDANGFDLKSPTVSPFMASCAFFVMGCIGFFSVYFGLRTTNDGGNYLWSWFLLISGMILSGVGFNAMAYFLYFGSQPR